MCHLLRMAGVAEEVETTRIAAWTKWKTKRYRGLLLLEALRWGGGQSRVWGSCYALSTSLAVTLEEGTMRGRGAQMLKVPWHSLLLGFLARPPCSFFLVLTALFWGQAHLEEGPGQCIWASDTCYSLSLQVAPSTSLFTPEDFKPLDPTQEPIFPPELLVGDAGDV